MTDTWSAYGQLALRLQIEISKLETDTLPLHDAEKKILNTMKKVLANFGSKGGGIVDKK